MGRRYVLVILALALTGCSTWCSQNPSECAAAFAKGRAMMAPATPLVVVPVPPVQCFTNGHYTFCQ